MTAALLDRASTRLPATRQPRRQGPPKLRVLDQAASRRRARHRSALLILFMAVLVGFFAVAFVHAELVAGQHELDAVRAEISQAEARHAELARTVEAASAPDRIVTRATELGMVRARQPVYLTAAAPVRSIEVGPSLLSSANPMAEGADVDGPSIAQVVSSDPGDPGRLRGTIGQPGGISAAIQIQRQPGTPAVALGTPASPAGASTAATAEGGIGAGATASPTPTASAPAVTTPSAPATGPSSSIAGASAASTPAPGSAAGAVPAASAPAPSSGANPAGGLASVAATTSG